MQHRMSNSVCRPAPYRMSVSRRLAASSGGTARIRPLAAEHGAPHHGHHPEMHARVHNAQPSPGDLAARPSDRLAGKPRLPPLWLITVDCMTAAPLATPSMSGCCRTTGTPGLNGSGGAPPITSTKGERGSRPRLDRQGKCPGRRPGWRRGTWLPRSGRRRQRPLRGPKRGSAEPDEV